MVPIIEAFDGGHKFYFVVRDIRGLKLHFQ